MVITEQLGKKSSGHPPPNDRIGYQQILSKKHRMITNTTIPQKAAWRKLNLPELASELENVSKACKIMGYSRTQFYEIRKTYLAFGSEGLSDQGRGPKKTLFKILCKGMEK